MTTHNNNEMFVATNVEAIASTEAAARAAIAALDKALAGVSISKARIRAAVACYEACRACADANPSLYDKSKLDGRTKYVFSSKVKELFKDAELCRADITMFAAVVTIAYEWGLSAEDFGQRLKTYNGGVNGFYRDNLDSLKPKRDEAAATTEATATEAGPPAKATTMPEATTSAEATEADATTTPVIDPWEAVKAKPILMNAYEKISDGVYLAVVNVKGAVTSLKLVTNDDAQIRAAVGGV